MIGFSRRLYLRSLRWLPVAVVLGLWSALAQTNQSPEAFAGPMVLGLFVTAALSTVLLANTDGDEHRHLLAAAAGGPSRLHRARMVASCELSFAVVAALVPWIVLSGTPVSTLGQVDTLWSVLAVMAALAGGAAAGVGLGGLLARPVVSTLATSVVGGLCSLVALLVVRPFLRQLDAVGIGSHIAAAAVLAEGATVLAAAWLIAPRLAARREGTAT